MEFQEKNSTSDIRDRIQFLVTITLFFVALFGDLVSKENSLLWGLGIAISILNFLLVGCVPKKSEQIRKWINGSVGLNLLFFVIPIISIILVQHGPLPEYYLILFMAFSLWSVLAPFITLMFIFFAIFDTKCSELNQSSSPS